jgi:hypothetical protein
MSLNDGLQRLLSSTEELALHHLILKEYRKKNPNMDFVKEIKERITKIHRQGI